MLVDGAVISQPAELYGLAKVLLDAGATAAAHRVAALAGSAGGAPADDANSKAVHGAVQASYAALGALPDGASVAQFCESVHAAAGPIHVAAAERALEPLSQALALAPNSELLNLAFARALIEARRYEAAVRVLRLVERTRRMGTALVLPAQAVSINLAWVPGEDELAAAAAEQAGKLAGTGTVTISSTEGGQTSLLIEPPALPSLPCLLALAQARAGDLPAAQTTLLTAVQGDPDGCTQDGKGAGPLLKAVRTVTEARDKGNEAYKGGKHEEAVSLYEAGQEAARKKLGGVPLSFFHSNAAAALMALNRHEDALTECMAALRAYPANAKAWSRAATCLAALKPINHTGVAAATAALQWLSPEEVAATGKALLNARSKGGDDSVDGHGQTVLEGLEGLVRPLAQPQDDTQYQKALGDWKAGKGKKAAGRLAPIFAPDPAATPAALKDPGSSRLQLVDWFATWCGPCKAIAPLFVQMAASTAPMAFVKVDGDLCKNSAAGQNAPPVKGEQAGAGSCKPAGGDCCGGGGCGSGSGASSSGGGGVRAFPTFTLFLDGEELSRLEGGDPARLSSMVKEGLQAWAAAPPRPGPVKLPGTHGSAPAPPALAEAVMAKDGRADVTVPLAQALRTLGVV